jgi:hypothetical protein
MVNDTCEGEFDWSGELVPVQGFGYMPSCVDREMGRRFQVSWYLYHGFVWISICIDKQMGWNIFKISARANGGPRSPSAHAWPFARPPIDTSGNFPANMSAESPLNTSPNPSEPLGNFSKYPPFPPKNRIVRGIGGSSMIFLVGLLIFWLLRSPCKISEPYNNLICEN